MAVQSKYKVSGVTYVLGKLELGTISMENDKETLLIQPIERPVELVSITANGKKKSPMCEAGDQVTV